MKLLLHLHVATVAVTASYLTLGLSDSEAAQELWAVYALVILALNIPALLIERRIHDRTPNRP